MKASRIAKDFRMLQHLPRLLDIWRICAAYRLDTLIGRDPNSTLYKSGVIII
jgi:hypothetical protein